MSDADGTAAAGGPDDLGADRDEIADLVRPANTPDVELALANVLDDARHRRVRDRVLLAGTAAAVVLLLIAIVATWDRSGSDNLETAGGPGTTTRRTTAMGPSDTGVGYSGDPDGTGTTGTTTEETVPESTSTTVGASTSTTKASSSTTQAGAKDPVLQVVIHADAASVPAGGRAWFTVQVHNSGGEVTYFPDCVGFPFEVTLTPSLPAPASTRAPWSPPDPTTFAAAVQEGGGGVTSGIAAGSRVGRLAALQLCADLIDKPKLAPGATLSEHVAVDLAPPPGGTLAPSYSAAATFRAKVEGGEPKAFAGGAADISVTGTVPALPDAAKLQASVELAPVATWIQAAGGTLQLQTRYYRSAWEVYLYPPITGQATVLRIRYTASGDVADVRTVKNASAMSDDTGATAPVVDEHVLYP